MADISVVVPTHDDGELLERCLASIAAQTLAPLEVIVVDDGSTAPGAIAGIVRARAAFPATRFFRQEQAGPSAARNRGLAACRGAFVAFVDCDDEMLPDNLRVKRALLDADDVVAAFGGIVFAEADGREHRSTYPPHRGRLDPARIGSRQGIPGFLWAYLLRTDAVRSVGGLDAALSQMEDYDLLIRLGRGGGIFVGCNAPVYRQDRQPGSLTRGSALRHARGALRFLAKARRCGYFGPIELASRYARVPYASLKIILRNRRAAAVQDSPTSR